VTQCIDAVHADIGNRTTTGHGRIVKPGSRMAACGLKRKFRSRKNRPPDLPGGNPVAEASCAVFKAEDLSYSQEQGCFTCALDHTAALICIDRHWAFPKGT